ncbi:Mobile element protein [Streptococcus pneumoniae]|nr:Mobile element protein [Streptococcus pneumoniae]
MSRRNIGQTGKILADSGYQRAHEDISSSTNST